MRVVSGEHVEVNVVAYAIIGDGARDERIFRAIAEKFNHTKVIRIPQVPRGVRPSGPCGLKGLAGCIEVIAACVDKTNVKTYICIIDREHIGPEDSVEKELRRVLTTRGFVIESREQLGFGAWLVRTVRSGKAVQLYIAILGYSKCIEENLAELIKLLYGQVIEPNKCSIKRWLDEHNLRDEDLVRRASKQALKEAFSSIVAIVDRLSQDPST